MAFYDGGQRPEPDKDPTKNIQWEIQHLAKSLGTDILARVTELIELAIGGVLEGIGNLLRGLFEALLTGNIIGGIEEFLINMPGVNLLVTAILGEGFEVGDLADYFTEKFFDLGRLTEHVPVLSQIVRMLQQEEIPPVTLPATFPMTFGETPHPVLLFIRRVMSLFNLLNWLDPDWDPLAVWASIVSDFINPLGLLNQIGVPVIQRLVDDFFDAINFGESGQTTGNAIASFFTSALEILNIGSQANSHNIVQDTYINQLLLGSGDNGIVDNFDGPENNSPDPAIWVVNYLEGSAGHIELSGDGALRWDRNGGVPRRCYLRCVDTLNSGVITVKFNLLNNVVSGYTSDPFMCVTGMGSPDNLDWIQAFISGNTVALQYVINTNATTFPGASVSYPNATAGVWEMKVGTTVHDRRIELYHNSNFIIGYTDSTGLARFGIVGATDYTANRHPGLIHRCGNGIETIFTTKQIPGPPVGSFTAQDRGLAA